MHESYGIFLYCSMTGEGLAPVDVSSAIPAILFVVTLPLHFSSFTVYARTNIFLDAQLNLSFPDLSLTMS